MSLQEWEGEEMVDKLLHTIIIHHSPFVMHMSVMVTIVMFVTNVMQGYPTELLNLLNVSSLFVKKKIGIQIFGAHVSRGQGGGACKC